MIQHTCVDSLPLPGTEDIEMYKEDMVCVLFGIYSTMDSLNQSVVL